MMLIAAAVTAAAVKATAGGTYFLEEGFYYDVQGGEAYVHGYEGDEWDIVIRELFLDKYYVTGIESMAFFENDTMTALSFYDATGLRSIGSSAFCRCTALERVNIPAQIEEMDIGVFDHCTALSYVRYHKDAISYIPAQTFYSCSSLETVVFLNDLERIGNLAFAYCTSLEKIELPDSVNSIADNAFYGCDGLLIYCSYGSYAQSWAVEHGFDYRLTDLGVSCYMRGDVDFSSKTNVYDAAFIQKAIAGAYGYPEYKDMDVNSPQLMAADVDLSGSVNIFDASIILRHNTGDSTTAKYGIGTVITL